MKTVKSLDKVTSKGYILGMKKVLLVIIPTFLFIVAVYATTYEYFQAHSEGDNILLEWKTGDENGLQKFIIQRKTPQTSYIEIATIQPKGSNSFYSYKDESAYKTQDLLFVYQLVFVDVNGSRSTSNEIRVSSQVSGVKRTWGSIKAMFR